MKHKLLPFFVLLALSSLVILHSCTKPGDDTRACTDDTKSYKLSAKDKALILYTGYDTINMVSNTGDTIHCIGSGKQYFTTREFVPYSDPACPGSGTEKFYEAYKIEFVDSSKNMKIELVHYYHHFYNNISRYYDVAVFFRGGAWLITDFHISKKTVQSYIGDSSINNITYKDVNKVGNYNSEDAPLSFMLINKTEGIIKLQLNAADSWVLIDQ